MICNCNSSKYPGPIVRLSPTEVIFSDANTLRRVSGIRSQYTRGPFYEVMRAQPNKDHVSSTRDEQRHKELKSKMGPGVGFLQMPTQAYQLD